MKIGNAEKILFEILSKREGMPMGDWLVSLGRAEVERLDASSDMDLMAELGRLVWEQSKGNSNPAPQSNQDTGSQDDVQKGSVRCIHCLEYKEAGKFQDEVEYGLEVCQDCKNKFEIALHGSLGQRPVFKGVICKQCKVEKGKNAFDVGSETCRKCLGTNTAGIKRKVCSECGIEKGVTAYKVGEDTCGSCKKSGPPPDFDDELEILLDDIAQQETDCIVCGSSVMMPEGHKEPFVCNSCEEQVEMALSDTLKPGT